MSWLPIALNTKELKAALEVAVPGLTYRAMFGGFAVYANGRVVAGITDQGYMLKASITGTEEVLSFPDARPWQHRPDMPVSKQYVVVRPQDAHRWLRERLDS